MGSMTLEFALNSVKLAKSWITGGSRVGSRDVFSIPGTDRVAFGGVGIKDGGKGRAQLVCVASADPSGPSSQPPKPSRKSRRKGEGLSKSDLKLVKDLKEFISAYDLPPAEVPTTKDLINNGRQDLANAVRRRGYKSVAGLLGFTSETRTADSTVDLANHTTAQSPSRDITENGAAGSSSTESQLISNTVEKETEFLVASTGEDESRSSSLGGSVEKYARSNGFVSYSENTLRETSTSKPALVPEVLNLDSQQKEYVGQTFLGDRGDYIQQRQLDLIKGREDGDYNFVGNGEESGSDSTDDEWEDDGEEYDGEDNDSSIELIVAQTDPSFESAEEVAAKKAALLRSRILEYFDSRKDDQLKLGTIQDGRLPKQVSLQQEINVVEKDMELENNQKLEAEKELERIKKLLHERESVLADVTKELEEAKAQFSLARAKATAELVHATQLAAEREARLQSAEQVLSSLRQVHLEWWGEAKHVELAGTFNGWQHRILMEPDPSSEIPKPDGSRGPMMWGTHLCLYPGVYEIKFIVDGNWQLDHRREAVMRHGNQNNVLRVEL